MSSVIVYEALLLLLSFLTGIWLMILYDVLRLFRLVLRHTSFWIGIEDIFYWLCSGFVTFRLLYEQNDGAFRMYVVAGVLAGMIIYDRLVSRIFFRTLKKLGKCLKMVRNRYAGKGTASCEHEREKAGE